MYRYCYCRHHCKFILSQMEHPNCGGAHGQFNIELFTRDKEVVALLRAAFQRRLVLKIDNNNTVVWNIPHR